MEENVAAACKRAGVGNEVSARRNSFGTVANSTVSGT
jgi:hypothetical protein